MKNLFKLISLSFLFLMVFACRSNDNYGARNCSAQQLPNGNYQMINNNCQNCQYMTVYDMNGNVRNISFNEGLSIVNSSGYTGNNYNQSNILSDLILYNFLFNNRESMPRSYQARYENQYNDYITNRNFYKNAKVEEGGFKNYLNKKESSGFSINNNTNNNNNNFDNNRNKSYTDGTKVNKSISSGFNRNYSLNKSNSSGFNNNNTSQYKSSNSNFYKPNNSSSSSSINKSTSSGFKR